LDLNYYNPMIPGISLPALRLRKRTTLFSLSYVRGLRALRVLRGSGVIMSSTGDFPGIARETGQP
jgi:hypothetical protein